MKIKFLTFIMFFLLGVALPAFSEEISTLYLIKEVQKSNLDNFTKAYLDQNSYKYIQHDGYLIENINSSSTFTSILIKQNSTDCYFYSFTTAKKEKLTQNLIKQIKKSGLKTKKIRNNELKDLFYNDISKSNSVGLKAQSYSDINTVYDFSDAAQENFDLKMNKYSGLKTQGNKKLLSQNKNIKNNENTVFSPLDEISTTSTQKIREIIPFSPLQGNVIQIPQGTIINAVLQSSISSHSVSQNDVITAVLENDWIYNGSLIAPAGSILYGQVTDAQKAGYAYGNGEIEITFTSMLSTAGTKLTLPHNTVKLESQINRPIKIFAEVLAGAITGVASGVVYSLISGGDISRGLAIGAGVGGAGGLIHSSLQKGEDVEIPTGTNLQIKLNDIMKVVPVY